MRRLSSVLVLLLVVASALPVFAQGDMSIVDIAVADGRFTTLVAAVQAAGLVETLDSDGPFTVFAPTDDAFAAAFEALGIAPADLLADTETLTDILLYHVVAGKAMAADVVGLDSVETVQGSSIAITVSDEGVFLNDTVQVIITDIEASNGVIHVIDAVLLPPAEEDMGMMDMGTIVDIAVADGRFTTLVAAVQAAGLADALSGEGPLTVFAPTDDAFAALPEGTVEALLNDIPALTDILLYHVVSGKAMAADVVGLEAATTLQGFDVSISASDMGVYLNDTTQVIITDIEASNGVIHVIDSVLLPPCAVTREAGANLNFRAGASLDAEVIGTFMVGSKAPAMGRDISGEWVQIAYEGEMGWVNAPLSTLSCELGSLDIAQDIVDVAVADGRFTTLVAAVGAADLVDALKGEGPLTVFAPTDDAFAALPAGTVEALLNDIPALTDILLYHVVAGKAMAADVVGLDSVTTLQGADVRISASDMGVFLNDSTQVIITDIETSNGVIHVIDSVLLPPSN